MATQYSILSILIRPEVQEKITIGFLLMDEETVFFDFSKHKLAVAKHLLTINAFKSLKDALLNINSYAINHSTNQQTSNGSNKVIAFKKSYIEYLSRYNNNILSFSSPKDIELEASLDIFSKLYKKFIDNSEVVIEQKPFIRDIQIFKEQKHSDLIKHFNIDSKVTSKEVPSLIAPVTITFIGQNELPTFVQSLDFEKRSDFLRNDISEILYLQRAFKDENKDSVAMVITNEPNKSNFSSQHDIWRQLRNTSDIKNFDISEADAVIEYAEEHNVQPFVNS